MPDWSYQTLFRPMLFWMSPHAARAFTLRSMGLLAKLPLGCHIIDFLGHMRNLPEDAFGRQSFAFSSRVGLSALIDTQLWATTALSRFGFGVLEIGPLGGDPKKSEHVELDRPREFAGITAACTRRCPHEIASILRQIPGEVATFARLSSQATLEESASLIAKLSRWIVGWIVPCEILDDRFLQKLATLRQQLLSSPALLLVACPHGLTQDAMDIIQRLVESQTIDGILLEPNADEADSLVGCADDLPHTLSALRTARDKLGPKPLILARGGVHEPEHASQVINCGADVALVDAGFVFSGPGLPKRCVEAIRPAVASADRPTGKRSAELSWSWLTALGLGLSLGGLAALALALSRVILPYDEALTGLSRSQIQELVPKMLSFMRHDRTTLSVTMLSVGILYVSLALNGVRQGMHWAWKAIVLSAAAGFASFFLFLGFGYFDPFHAFITAVSLPVLLIGIFAPLPPRAVEPVLDLHNDNIWRLAQWGQLLLVAQGVAVAIAGAVIAYVGCTQVFVTEDIDFLCTSEGLLRDAHPLLIPLVAHDRASFGGMLLSCGLVTLCTALWGIRRGRSWIFWTWLAAGTMGYGGAIWIHWHVGYLSQWHLLPAYLGYADLLLSLALLRGYLLTKTPTGTNAQE